MGKGKEAFSLASLSQTQTFIRGAFLITLAQLISRVLGAIYRPVAQLFIGDRGLALVTPPNSAYFIVAALSSVGMNVAISRLISERLALGDYAGARRVFRVATGLLLISGLCFAALFAAGSGWLAAALGFPEARAGFLVLAPAVFLVSLLCTFRGLYQGMQQMRPSAMSQVVEQVGRVGLGLILVALLSSLSVQYGAAGFNAGNTAGILLAILYGAWVYFRERPTAAWAALEAEQQVEGSWRDEPVSRLVGRIIAIALPLSLIGATMPLMQFIDSALVTNRLMATGVPEGAAKEALAYLANAGTLRDLPAILTSALYVSLVPAIAESAATGHWAQARYRAATAFRLTLLIGLPATAGLLVGARDVYGVLYQGPGWTVMAPLAWSTLFLMLQQTSAGILQGLGQVGTSVRNLLAGIVVKILLTYLWTGWPALGVRGAAYATGVAFATAAGLNLWALNRSLGLGISLRNDVGRPLLASVLMSVAIWLLQPAVHRLIPFLRLAGLTVVVLGALVYLAAILAVRGVTEADLGLIPGVRPWMVTALQRCGLLREEEKGGMQA